MAGSFKYIPQSFFSQDIDLQEFVSKSQFLTPESWLNNPPEFPARIRQKLVAAIRTQYQDLALPPTFELLGQPNCYTVTTGHQLGLNGGPLFVLYKILHTIELAKILSQKSAIQNIVPIFWMATEDHDFQEVNHFWVNFSQKVCYLEAFTNTPVGEILLKQGHFLPEDFLRLHQAFKQDGKTWKDAFRKLLHHYFNSHGLIILDGNDALLKQEIIPYLSDDLKNATAFQAIRETNTRLQAQRFPIQAFVREINWFYLSDNKRVKLEQLNNSFYAGDIKRWADITEMLNEAHENPQQFSPNVLLRPVYQQVILPNLAYVGGWAEITYWLQLKALFGRWLVNFPVLVPRFSALLYTQEQRASWEKYSLNLADLLGSNSTLRKKIAEQFYDNKSVKDQFEVFLAQANQLTQYLLDNHLIHPATRGSFQNSLENHFSNWEKKFWKRLYSKHTAVFDSILNLKNQLQPEGVVQERTLNWVELTNRFPNLMLQIQPLISDFAGKSVTIELVR